MVSKATLSFLGIVGGTAAGIWWIHQTQVEEREVRRWSTWGARHLARVQAEPFRARPLAECVRPRPGAATSAVSGSRPRPGARTPRPSTAPRAPHSPAL